MSKPKAYSYLRFSTPDQIHGDSFRRQTELAMEYCQKHGLELDTEVTYHDLGVSAFRGKNAETGALAGFLEAVRRGVARRGSFLLVESLDRISRLAARKALRILEDICEEDVTVVTLSDGKAYTKETLDNDPMSLIMSVLIFIRANEESTMKSRRLKAAWVGKRMKVSDGKALTARCPGWLKLNKETGKWVVIEDRAAVVRRIFESAAAGHGPLKIAEKLNRDRIPVFGPGVQWHRSFIVKLLDESPAVIGTYVPKTIEFVEGKKTRRPLDPIPNYFPAVVPAELYQQVRAMRSSIQSPLRGKTTKVYNLFAGLVRCSRCGSSMTLQNKASPKYPGKGLRYLVCSKARYGAGCKYTAVRYQEVEGFFLEAAQRILMLAPGKTEDFEGQLSEIELAVEQLEIRKATLLDGYERTRDDSMLERLVPINEELDELKGKRKELVGRIEATDRGMVSRRVDDLKKLLVGAKPAEFDRGLVNAALRALFSGVSLNPDTGVATLGWHHGGSSEFTFAWPEAA